MFKSAKDNQRDVITLKELKSNLIQAIYEPIASQIVKYDGVISETAMRQQQEFTNEYLNKIIYVTKEYIIYEIINKSFKEIEYKINNIVSEIREQKFDVKRFLGQIKFEHICFQNDNTNKYSLNFELCFPNMQNILAIHFCGDIKFKDEIIKFTDLYYIKFCIKKDQLDDKIINYAIEILEYYASMPILYLFFDDFFDVIFNLRNNYLYLMNGFQAKIKEIHKKLILNFKENAEDIYLNFRKRIDTIYFIYTVPLDLRDCFELYENLYDEYVKDRDLKKYINNIVCNNYEDEQEPENNFNIEIPEDEEKLTKLYDFCFMQLKKYFNRIFDDSLVEYSEEEIEIKEEEDIAEKYFIDNSCVCDDLSLLIPMYLVFNTLIQDENRDFFENMIESLYEQFIDSIGDYFIHKLDLNEFDDYFDRIDRCRIEIKENFNFYPKEKKYENTLFSY